MAERLQLWAFRLQGRVDPWRVFDDSVQSIGGSLSSSEDRPGMRIPVNLLLQVSQDAVLSFALARPTLEEFPHAAFLEIAGAIGCPALETRVHDGAYWDYVLYRGSEMLDKFGTWPEFFSERGDETRRAIEQWKGNVGTLAREWGIERTQIENYIVKWPLTNRGQPERTRSRAYAQDAYRIGDCRQIHDFLRAMGIAVPTRKEGRSIRIYLPERFEVG